MFPFSVARQSSIETSTPSIEGSDFFSRAPGLRDSGELAIATIVKNLQTMAGPATTIEGMLAGFTSNTPRDVIANLRPDSVVGSIVVKDLSCVMLATLDGTLVHALVELLCGGNGVEPQPVEPRPVTPIDQQFAQIVFTLAASAVQAEWAGVGFGSAQAAKIDGLLTADIFGARVDEVGVLDVTISIFGLHGTLQLVLPPPVFDLFASETPSMSFEVSADPFWANQLQTELGQTPVTLSAYLQAKDLPLGSLAGLRVGQILPLPSDARSRALLVSDGVTLFRGEVGRDDDRYSLRVEEFVRESAAAARVPPYRAPSFEMSKG